MNTISNFYTLVHTKLPPRYALGLVACLALTPGGEGVASRPTPPPTYSFCPNKNFCIAAATDPAIAPQKNKRGAGPTFGPRWVIAAHTPGSGVPNATDMITPKTVGNTDASGTQVNVPDVQFFGNGDTFQLLCKASSQSQGWMKSTKAMHIPGVGCVVQITTQQTNPDGTYAIAEAAVFVPGAKIVKDGTGRKLASEKKKGGAGEEPEPPPPPAEDKQPSAPEETTEDKELSPPPTEIPADPAEDKKD